MISLCHVRMPGECHSLYTFPSQSLDANSEIFIHLNAASTSPSIQPLTSGLVPEVLQANQLQILNRDAHSGFIQRPIAHTSKKIDAMKVNWKISTAASKRPTRAVNRQ